MGPSHNFDGEVQKPHIRKDGKRYLYLFPNLFLHSKCNYFKIRLKVTKKLTVKDPTLEAG